MSVQINESHIHQVFYCVKDACCMGTSIFQFPCLFLQGDQACAFVHLTSFLFLIFVIREEYSSFNFLQILNSFFKRNVLSGSRCTLPFAHTIRMGKKKKQKKKLFFARNITSYCIHPNFHSPPPSHHRGVRLQQTLFSHTSRTE